MTERGTVLAGRYELDQIIGRGGMAEVWRGRDRRLARDVAVKRLRLDLASDPTFQARFRREAQSSAGLNHPNIVAVYDTGEEIDPNSDVSVPYIVMELVEGVTLRDVLRDGRKIVPQRALEFTKGVLDALAYAHRAGIVHRDIKPANVMLTPSGSVKVMDFGIARAVADTSATMTQTAAVIGTAQYLSPEQARGEKVDNRSDLYSVGCLLYELLVSQPPFKGDSPVSVAYQHVREAPVPPSQLDPEITPDMDAIVLKALAKDPADRYQDAREFAADVTRAMNNEPVHAISPAPEQAATAVLGGSAAGATGVPPRSAASPVPMDSPTEVATQEKKKSRAGLIVLLVVAGLVLIGLIAGAWALLNPPQPQVREAQVPYVIDMLEADARAEVEAVNLVPAVEYVEGEDSDVGRVVRQDPTFGQTREEGSTVTLYVSEGPTRVQIPEGLVGMPEDQAIAALEEVGLTNVTVVPDNPRDEDIRFSAGEVTKVDPAPGGEVPPTAEITLTIATGESIVPNLRNMTISEAQDTAENAGFRVRERVVETNGQTNGLIFNQSLSPGSRAERGQTIDVDVAKSPAPSPTPTTTVTVTASPEPVPEPTEVEPGPPEPEPTDEDTTRSEGEGEGEGGEGEG